MFPSTCRSPSQPGRKSGDGAPCWASRSWRALGWSFWTRSTWFCRCNYHRLCTICILKIKLKVFKAILVPQGLAKWECILFNFVFLPFQSVLFPKFPFGIIDSKLPFLFSDIKYLSTLGHIQRVPSFGIYSSCILMKRTLIFFCASVIAVGPANLAGSCVHSNIPDIWYLWIFTVEKMDSSLWWKTLEHIQVVYKWKALHIWKSYWR